MVLRCGNTTRSPAFTELLDVILVFLKVFKTLVPPRVGRGPAVGSSFDAAPSRSSDFLRLLKCPLSSSLTSTGTQSGRGRGGDPGLPPLISPPPVPNQPPWKRRARVSKNSFFQIGPYKYFIGLMTRDCLGSERSHWIIHYELL